MNKAFNRYYFWVSHFILGVFSRWSSTTVWSNIGKYSLSPAYLQGIEGLNEEDGEYSNELEIVEANQKQSREERIRGLNSVKLIKN